MAATKAPPTLDISTRGKQLPASPIRRLAPHAAAALQRGVRIYNLNIGQPDVPTPQRMLDRLHSYPEQVVAYGPSEGRLDLREALAGYYQSVGYGVEPDDLIVTTGGSEAILMSLAVITDPGDEIVVPEPFYSNYNGFSTIVGCTVRPVTTSIETGFHLPDREAFEAVIGPRTKAIVICSPNNPTGAVLTADEIEMVCALAAEHGLFVVADEAYREFVFDGRQHHSPMTIAGAEEHVIVVDSLSKRYSACGARLGALVTKNQSVRSAALRYGMARLCPPTVAQYWALALLELDAGYTASVRDEYQARRDVVMEMLGSHPEIVCEKPEGAFYVVAGLPVDDAQSFCVWMLDAFKVDGKTVMLAPADGFYATPGLGTTEVRIAFVLEPERMRKAMEIILAGVDEYNRRG